MIGALLYAVAFVGDNPATQPVMPPRPPIVAAPAPPAPEPTTTTTVPAHQPAISGHYTCTGDSNETAVCGLDPAGGPPAVNVPVSPPSIGGDVPGQTLGSTDAGYGAALAAAICDAAPWRCDAPSTG